MVHRDVATVKHTLPGVPHRKHVPLHALSGMMSLLQYEGDTPADLLQDETCKEGGHSAFH